jgi:hypothetical protein
VKGVVHMQTYHARTAKECIRKAFLAAVTLGAGRAALCTSCLRMIFTSTFAVHQGIQEILEVVFCPDIEWPVLYSLRIRKHPLRQNERYKTHRIPGFSRSRFDWMTLIKRETLLGLHRVLQ